MSKRSRYELVDPAENANKFWEIEVSGAKVTTFWGRIGVAPSQKTKDFGSPARAESEAAKLIRQKEKKGYKFVSSSGSFKISAKTKKTPKAKKDKKSGQKTTALLGVDFGSHDQRSPKGVASYDIDSGWKFPKPDPTELEQYRKNLLKAGVAAIGPAPERQVRDGQDLILGGCRDNQEDCMIAFAVKHGLFCTADGNAMIVVPHSLRKSIRSIIGAQIEVTSEHMAEGGRDARSGRARLKWLEALLAE